MCYDSKKNTPTLGVMLLSEAEAVVELSRRVGLDRTIVWMTPLQHWLGQKVQILCRAVTSKEVEQARKPKEEEQRESIVDTQEGRIQRIQTFSGSTPPNKNDTTFAQWIHEVREAQARILESTVRNWISRSL